MLALIYVPAGTFQYWQGWAYVAVFFIICSSAYAVYLAKARSGIAELDALKPASLTKKNSRRKS